MAAHAVKTWRITSMTVSVLLATLERSVRTTETSVWDMTVRMEPHVSMAHGSTPVLVHSVRL